MQLLIAESAFNDLADIRAYYLEQAVDHIGEQFVTAIIKHIEVLIDHPEIGRIVPEFAQANIRELIHPPFRVVYWLDAVRSMWLGCGAVKGFYNCLRLIEN